MSDQELSLLNVFDVEIEGIERHLVCFIEPVRAGAEGISSRAIVGEFRPAPDGNFDPRTFQLNPEFVEAVTGYMNDRAIRTPEMVAQARSQPSGWLYVVDPRHVGGVEDEPEARELLGCFAVDGDGQIVPNSFQYNAHHVWFDPESGVSGVFADRRFHDWLHPAS